jgi:hypothetical protein
LEAKPWVTSITERTERNRTLWVVDVNDDSVARKQLLRTLLADDGVDVLDFGLKQYELEEIFMKIVEDDSNDN